MTGSAGWSDPEQMTAQGFDSTLAKPMTLAQLHDCLAAVLPDRPEQDAGPRSLDVSVLDTLANDLGDLDLVHETVRTYLHELPIRLDIMDAALQAGDQARLKETAHSLKSASAMLGAIHMAQLCGQVERAAGTESVDSDGLVDVLAESDRVRSAINAYLT